VIYKEFLDVETVFEALLNKITQNETPESETERSSSSSSESKDTVEILKTFKSILSDRKISQSIFVREILGMNDSNFCKIIKNPLPWSECSEHQKRIWSKTEQWTKSPDAIQSLKTLNESEHKDRKLTKLPEIDSNLTLNTSELAQTVCGILKSECISYNLFAKEVFRMSEWEVTKLLRNPVPWPACNLYKKRFYLKLHEWSRSKEAVQSLIEIGNPSRWRNSFESSYRKLPNVPEHVELDTCVVAERVRAILKAERISGDLFSRHVVFVHASHVGELLRKPVPWSQCSEYKKRIFYKAHMWSQSPEQIKSLRNQSENC
jgi:hypothetical protein